MRHELYTVRVRFRCRFKSPVDVYTDPQSRRWSWPHLGWL